MSLERVVTPEQRIRERLEFVEANGKTEAGLYHPDDQAVALAMMRAGEIAVRDGEGRDKGLLLIRRVSARTRVAGRGEGGSAA